MVDQSRDYGVRYTCIPLKSGGVVVALATSLESQHQCVPAGSNTHYKWKVICELFFTSFGHFPAWRSHLATGFPAPIGHARPDVVGKPPIPPRPGVIPIRPRYGFDENSEMVQFLGAKSSWVHVVDPFQKNGLGLETRETGLTSYHKTKVAFEGNHQT